MGRYFKAQPVELNRDFIYQPPLELMAKALLKKDDDIQQQADTMELIRSLPIDFIDYHKEGAANIKNEINSDIDNFAKEIQTEGALNGSLKSKLNAYKNQLQQRYDTGDIYNIQQTKKNYEEFAKKVDEDKNLSSALKEKHKQEYWNQYTNENPGGAYNSVYTPGPIIQEAMGLERYTDWFKNLKPDEKKTIIEKAGGKWNTLTETEKNNIVLENGFEDFVNSTPDLKDIYLQQGKSSIFRDRNLLNPDGTLNYKSGHLSDVVRAAKELNYTQTVDSKKLEQNPYYMWEIDRADRLRAEAQARKDMMLAMDINKDVSGGWELSNNQRYRNREELLKIASGLMNDVNGKQTKFSAAQLDRMTETKLLEMINKGLTKFPNNKVLKTKRDEVLNLIETSRNQMKATYMPLTTRFGLSPEGTEKVIKKHDESIAANFHRIKLNFPLLETVKGDKIHKDNYQNILPQSFVGKEMITQAGDKVKISKVEYKPKSNSMYIDPRTKSLADINHNDTDIMVRFYYNNGEDYFEKPAFFDNSTNIGLEGF